MLGNLVENAAKYGGGRVFVTVEPKGRHGRHPGRGRRPRHPRPSSAASCSARGARLDTTGKPGTGLGLAIVRDVAEIYGGIDPPRGKRGSRRAAGAADACPPARPAAASSKSALTRANLPGLDGRILPGGTLTMKIKVLAASRRWPCVSAIAQPGRCQRASSPPRRRYSAPGATTSPRWTVGQAGRRFLRLRQRRLGQAHRRSPPTAPSPASIPCSTTRSTRDVRDDRRGHGQGPRRESGRSASRSATSTPAGWTRPRSKARGTAAAEALSRPDRRREDRAPI